MKAVLDDDASPLEHALARHDVEQPFETFLKRHELLYFQVTRSQLS